MNKLKKMPPDLRKWLKSKYCECEKELSSYLICCGKNYDEFMAIAHWASRAPRVFPTFKSLEKEKRAKIIESLSKIYAGVEKAAYKDEA